MHAVIVSFRLRDLGDRAFRELAEGAAPAFVAVPGLLSKVWLSDGPTGTHGGLYVFATAEDADRYLASRLFAEGVAGNPHFADVQVRRSGVLEWPTLMTAPGLAAPAGV